MQLVYFIFIACIAFRVVTIGSSVYVSHANTTRLCRDKCLIYFRPFQEPFSVLSNCGDVFSFYGCMVEIDVNYTGHTINVKFSGHMENSVEMYLIDYDYSIDEALNIAFYRNLFNTKVIFTCLTQDYCTEEYASLVIQRLITNAYILYKLLPIYLDASFGNRTISCINTSNSVIPCYGGYCESMTQETISWWSYHDCGYPSESSVLSATELTSLTAFFIQFEPESPTHDQVNDNKITVLCNVDLCNSLETRNQVKLILDEYNREVFEIFRNNNVVTTENSTLTSTLNPMNTTIMSHPSSEQTSTKTSIIFTSCLPTKQSSVVSNNTTLKSSQGFQVWSLATMLTVVMMVLR